MDAAAELVGVGVNAVSDGKLLVGAAAELDTGVAVASGEPVDAPGAAYSRKLGEMRNAEPGAGQPLHLTMAYDSNEHL